MDNGDIKGGCMLSWGLTSMTKQMKKRSEIPLNKHTRDILNLSPDDQTVVVN